MRDELYTSGRYGTQHPDWHEEDAAAKAAAVASLLRYGGVQPLTVVDVGCGTGGVLRLLAGRLGDRWPEAHFEGWDIAKAAIRKARVHEGGQLHFVHGDFLASERQADLLLCLDVFEHVQDDVGFLEQLASRARWMVFRIPLDLSVWDVARPRRLVEAGPTLGHRHVYTRELALQRLDLAGYRVVEERYHRIRHGRPRGLDPLRSVWRRFSPHGAARWLGGVSLLVLAEPRIPATGPQG
jgi:SAM-dependent methyltransferase